MQWELAKPKEFEQIAQKEQLCIVPIGCLERHGEHAPFGTDSLIVHKVAVEAAKIEPCMVFPPMYFGTQSHEASCFSGTVVFPNSLCFALWDNLCKEIARNGFRKILFLNAHGGNTGMLSHYALSTVDHQEDYVFYYMDFDAFSSEEEEAGLNAIEPRTVKGVIAGHACQWETDMVMAVAPGSVDLSRIPSKETVYPLKRNAHLGRIKTGLDWYSNYPDHVVGTPAIASQEKGEQMLKLYVERLAKDIRIIKEDKEIPRLQKEFQFRRNQVGRYEG